MTDIATYRGISVIICCYNSSQKIKETLRALSRQEFTIALEWEIILVDNASTDDTSNIAKLFWDSLSKNVLLTLLNEPKQGLMHARNKGISAAKYSLLVFCDDDNHLSPHYLQGMYFNLKNNPRIGACGGQGIPIFEIEKPEWFERYHEAYAVGSQYINREGGRLTNLYGAGLAIRKQALENLHDLGWQPITTGRKGKLLSNADDTELTYAMVISGYKLMYDSSLQFEHYLPEERLQLKYIEKLFAGFGVDGPIRNLYFAYISHSPVHRNLKNWYLHLILCLARIVKYLLVPPKPNSRKIYWKWNLAYTRSLFAIKGNYSSYKKNIEKLVPKGKPEYFINTKQRITVS